MRYIISYDISSSDTNRKKISDKLISYGMDRIQKSVFMGLISRKNYLKLVSELELMISLKEDNLIITPVCSEDLEKSVQHGKLIYFSNQNLEEVSFF